jgi:hypothetical protein
MIRHFPSPPTPSVSLVLLAESGPNKGIELTGNSVHSFVAPTAPSSSCLALGAKGAGEKPRGPTPSQETLPLLGGGLSTRGSLTRRGTVLRHRVRVPHSAKGFPPGLGRPTVFPGRAGAVGPAKPGAWGAFPCRVYGWRSLACLARIRASACTEAGPRGLASHGPQQAGRIAPGPGRGWSAAGWREATGAEAVSRPPRHQGGRVRRGGGLPRRGGVVQRSVVGQGGRDVTANPCAKISAQQGLAPDGLQPPLVPRCGFRPQVKPSVRLPRERRSRACMGRLQDRQKGGGALAMR